MQCNCIKQKEQELVGKVIGHKKVSRAEIISGILRADNFQFNSSSEVKLTFEGVKKQRILEIVHSYCPFCGKKIKP